MSHSTSEILNKAADLIQERGWVRGSEGWPGGSDAHLSPVCLEGAIQAAAGLRWGFEVGACPAAAAVIDYLGADACTDGFETRPYVWNDAPGRNAEQVITTLRAAAAIEQARENELTHNGVTYVAGAL